ncbi:MAG: precorrin-4 C(11)-methyltransferase [Muribaculaceae bacterium]|nr:precorrin-4 C(11)-methyltransferase [Muribaculaceae bacterium]
MKLIIYLNETGRLLADRIQTELKDYRQVCYNDFEISLFAECKAIIFIGALGVCVRMIAPAIRDKYTDPAVVCVDSAGHNVIAVLSGHIGGANRLCSEVARILGACPVITTQSDVTGLWTLDTLGTDYGWITEADHQEMNRAIAALVNGESVGLLLDVRDRGTDALERSMPHNVTLIKDRDKVEGFRLIIAVTPYLYHYDVPVLYFRPRVLNMGVGCRRDCNPHGVTDYIEQYLINHGISPLSVKSVSTIDIKKDEALVSELSHWKNIHFCNIYTSDELREIAVPNPSEKVRLVTGVAGVAESCALKASDGGKLIVEKQKGKLNEGGEFTFAVAIDKDAMRGGHIEIVGAGPGDPELISVRGKHFLQQADLILYAGSLVPKELTYYSKPGCTVISSAHLNLEEQFALMKKFYDRDMLIVRLHTGDPCIYGAIQEQMAFFDRYGMSYHITPGISSFQAAAAALKSQFTIPEKVQTIILTRGEGRTPMPEKEQLHKLAQSQSTMCIYLSAGIVDEVQRELLMAYPPDTPVAACYKLTWKEEKIYRGVLKDLARIVHDNHLTLTTLLVVGEAIDNREGLSRLYNEDFRHLFRP